MKCAKSVNVKKRTSASGSRGTGLSGCRPASSATIRGDADPTWCTCSSALGRPATKARRSARAPAASVVTGRQCAGCRAAAALPPARDAETGWQARAPGR